MFGAATGANTSTAAQPTAANMAASRISGTNHATPGLDRQGETDDQRGTITPRTF
jgi:hypothetical protein